MSLLVHSLLMRAVLSLSRIDMIHRNSGHIPLAFASSTSSPIGRSRINGNAFFGMGERNQPPSTARRCSGASTSESTRLFGSRDDGQVVSLYNSTGVDGHKEARIAQFLSNQTARRIRVLGITGGIGAGKSQVCKILSSCTEDVGNEGDSERGVFFREFQGGGNYSRVVEHIDTDKLAHTVYAPGSDAIQEIKDTFGEAVIKKNDVHDVEIDRQKLGKIVFADPESMSTLEQIVWPHVKSKIIDRCLEIEDEYYLNNSSYYYDKNTQPPIPVVVIEAAVMIDAGWDDLFDAIWVIRSNKSVQKQRLTSTRNMKDEDAMMRISAQDGRRGIGKNDEDSDNIDHLKEEMERGIVTAIVTNDETQTLTGLKETLERVFADPASWKKGQAPVNIAVDC